MTTSKERRIEIKTAVLDALSLLEDVQLPIPIKKIVRIYTNCRLIPYSYQMKHHHLSYQKQLSLAGTSDAYTDYYASKERYIIYYNDIDPKIMNSKRYRWSIAHELGHVLLGHHKQSQQTKLFRNRLSEHQYRIFEEEADLFASYILCPYAILCCFPIRGDGNIAALCNISQSAAANRYRDYKRWRKNWNHGTADKYDFKMRWLYTHQKRCTNCGCDIKNFDYSFCPICGKQDFLYLKEISKMIYTNIEIDEHGCVIKCPNCYNEELVTDANYCHICGTSAKNKCLGELDYVTQEYCGACDTSKNHNLPANARFCPYCGSDTTFKNILPSWENELNDGLPF